MSTSNVIILEQLLIMVNTYVVEVLIYINLVVLYKHKLCVENFDQFFQTIILIFKDKIN